MPDDGDPPVTGDVVTPDSGAPFSDPLKTSDNSRRNSATYTWVKIPESELPVSHKDLLAFLSKGKVWEHAAHELFPGSLPHPKKARYSESDWSKQADADMRNLMMRTKTLKTIFDRVTPQTLNFRP